MPTCRVDWPQAWRVIASRYPPITLFERLTPDTAVWDALVALEQLTNPRVRDEVGDIALVPPDERVTGPGASTANLQGKPEGARTRAHIPLTRPHDGSYGRHVPGAPRRTRAASAVVGRPSEAPDRGRRLEPVTCRRRRWLAGTVSVAGAASGQMPPAAESSCSHAEGAGSVRVPPLHAAHRCRGQRPHGP